MRWRRLHANGLLHPGQTERSLGFILFCCLVFASPHSYLPSPSQCTRYAPGRSRDLPHDTPPQASYDVQRHAFQGNPWYLQEVHDKCQPFLTYRRTINLQPNQPLEIFVDDETKLTLHGLQQFYVKLDEQAKNRKLNDLLDTLEFNQVCNNPVPSEPALTSP
jgi:hypothetical protein